jgi:hypothetical protein
LADRKIATPVGTGLLGHTQEAFSLLLNLGNLPSRRVPRTSATRPTRSISNEPLPARAPREWHRPRLGRFQQKYFGRLYGCRHHTPYRTAASHLIMWYLSPPSGSQVERDPLLFLCTRRASVRRTRKPRILPVSRTLTAFPGPLRRQNSPCLKHRVPVWNIAFQFARALRYCLCWLRPDIPPQEFPPAQSPLRPKPACYFRPRFFACCSSVIVSPFALARNVP